jgi:adenylylsulfate kinase-like enzyme
MREPTQALPSAAILLTGLSASGKTTLGRSLVQRLLESGIKNAVLIDGEELRARLSRAYGHSLEERYAVWREIVPLARSEMDAGKVVVMATIAHRAAVRAEARQLLQPFYEVHLDCPVEVCAARDRKGHYKRAFASEYECFIGVTHPYERSDSADLRLDTSALSPARAEAILAERVIAFLSESDQGSHFSPLQERLG